MVGGLVGAGFAGYTIYDDSDGWFGYTYSPPFTDHEMTVLAILAVSIVVFIIGSCIPIYSRKKKNTSDDTFTQF